MSTCFVLAVSLCNCLLFAFSYRAFLYAYEGELLLIAMCTCTSTCPKNLSSNRIYAVIFQHLSATHLSHIYAGEQSLPHDTTAALFEPNEPEDSFTPLEVVVEDLQVGACA